jgi:DNA-binding NarL/FixJ family response regulator
MKPGSSTQHAYPDRLDRTLPHRRDLTRLSEADEWYRKPMHDQVAGREEWDDRAGATTPRSSPTRVAVANDYEIVVAGLAAMLDREDDLEVVQMFVVGKEQPSEPIDVVLYDTFGREGVDQDQLKTLVTTSLVQHVVVFTLSWDDSLTKAALEQGVSGVLSKALKGEELAAHIREIAKGAIVVAPPPHGRIVSGTGRDWPGRSFGLSERESECLVLLAAGLRNAEIGRSLYVSEDTVKTHLKRAYRKLGVGNRAQATAIVLRHPSFVGQRSYLGHRDNGGQSAATANSSVPVSANERHRSA